jgi:phosphate-selective porin OprO/OprP
VADAFAPGRNTGLLIFDWAPEERRTYALGIFRSGSDGFGDDAGDREGLSVTGRVTCCPIYDEANDGRTYLHLGIGSSYRHAGDDGVCYRTRPEVFGRSESKGISTPYFADTGTLVARDSALLGTEFAWIAGPFSVQVEYMLASVDRPGAPDTLFHGGYLGLSYFLTGEHRPYDRQRASMDRVIPHANFLRIGGADGSCATGPGAWELAARISYVDLSDRDVDGGGLTDFTAGVNWYLTGYHRIKAHYVRAHLVRGPTGSSDTGIFALRFDMDF